MAKKIWILLLGCTIKACAPILGVESWPNSVYYFDALQDSTSASFLGVILSLIGNNEHDKISAEYAFEYADKKRFEEEARYFSEKIKKDLERRNAYKLQKLVQEQELAQAQQELTQAKMQKEKSTFITRELEERKEIMEEWDQDFWPQAHQNYFLLGISALQKTIEQNQKFIEQAIDTTIQNNLQYINRVTFECATESFTQLVVISNINDETRKKKIPSRFINIMEKAEVYLIQEMRKIFIERLTRYQLIAICNQENIEMQKILKEEKSGREKLHAMHSSISNNNSNEENITCSSQEDWKQLQRHEITKEIALHFSLSRKRMLAREQKEKQKNGEEDGKENDNEDKAE